MTSDLLFSVLPREGKVPIAHDELKVQKVSTDMAMRELSDKEQELHFEEREARQKQQSKSKKKAQNKKMETVEDEAENSLETEKAPKDDDKGFKHLDIYV